MRFLGPRLHGYCDVVLVACFVFGPLVFGLGGSPALISFLLAFVLLVLTLLTRYPFGLLAKVPLFVHGLVELAITVFVVLLPRLDGYSPGSPARSFYRGMGIALALVWLLTDYREPGRSPVAPRAPQQPRTV